MCRRASIAFRVAAVSLALAAVAPAETIVPGGDLSTTTWTKAGSPYRVTDTTTVPAGETLTIEPEVDVLFDADVPLAVVGRLAAIGTETDSILFLPGGAPAWHGLVIGGGDSSTIRFARVSGVAGSGIAIAGNGTRTGLSRSVLSGCNAGSGSRGGGIFVTGKARATLDSCRIAGNTAAYGGGAAVRDSAQATFRRCLIVKNAVTGVGGALVIETGGRATLVHVTIADNVAPTHAGIYVSAATLVARNSIVRPAIARDGRYPATIDVAYSLAGGVSGPGVFSGTPHFIDAENDDYRITRYSPCRDAGDPVSPLDPDGTITDLGAFGFAYPENYLVGTIATRTLTRALSPWQVVDDVEVPAGDTLTIEPGVEVRFSEIDPWGKGGRFTVKGRLVAVGTETDSVIFTGSYWGNIAFVGHDTSTLRFVRLTMAGNEEHPVLVTDSARVGFSRSAICRVWNAFASTGMGCLGHGRVTLDSCSIRENGTESEGAPGIVVGSGARALFTGCEIVNNRIYAGHAVAIASGGFARLERTLVARNGHAFYVAGRLELDRVTVTGNGGGVYDEGAINMDGGTLVARNCIFWGNVLDHDSTIVGTWHFDRTTYIADIAWSITERGWPGEGNIDVDPRFVDRSRRDYRPRLDSPAVDSGDPNSTPDSDGSRADMGWWSIADAPATAIIYIAPDTLFVANRTLSRLAIENRGWADATVSNLDLPGGFEARTPFPLTVPAGDSAAIAVAFTGTSDVGPGESVVRFSDAYLPPMPVVVCGVVGTSLAGYLSGVLRAADSPFRVGGTIVVSAGDSLVIEPGVDLIFDAYAGFHVFGRLRAIGTATDSIRFVPGIARRWRAIKISGGDSSAFAYVRISGGYPGFPPVGGYEPYGAHFGGWGGAIWASGSGTRMSLTHSVIRGNVSDYGGGGLGARDGASLSLRACMIADNSGDNGSAIIGSHAAVTADSCSIVGNSGRVTLSANGTMVLTRCVITGNSGSRLFSGNDIDVAFCTIAGNAVFEVAGGQMFPPGFTMRNSIVWATTPLIEAPDVAVATYSIIRSATPFRGVGNSNADPLFVDAANGDYRLAAGSPAIDAGDPASPRDPDDSRADIGAIASTYGVPLAVSVTRPLVFSLAQNAPNPFNPSTVIRFSLSHSGEACLAIYDVSGRLVRVLVDGQQTSGAHEVAWDGVDAAGRQVASGIYLYRLVAKDGTLVRRMALVR